MNDKTIFASFFAKPKEPEGHVPWEVQERLLREWREQKAERERQAIIAAAEEAKRKADEKKAIQQENARFKAGKAKDDKSFLNHRLWMQYGQRDLLMEQQKTLAPGSKAYETLQRKLIVLDNQIHTTEQKLAKARFDYRRASREIADA